MSRSRNFCYTWNNYADDKIASLKELPCRYHVIGFEKGEEKGTPHLQGFIMFKHQRTFGAVCKMLKGAHVEAARGAPWQAADYCKKDGEFWEQGDPPVSKKQQGEAEKARWKEIIKMSQEGQFDQLEEKHPGVYFNKIKLIEHHRQRHQRAPEPLEKPCGEWIWGPSGVGKTTKAREGVSSLYLKSCNKWWDGYDGQEVVVMDDVDPNHSCLGHHIKLWSDKWPFPAEVKGSSLTIRPKRFVITSQYSPEQVFQDQETLDAVRRRFDVTHMMGENFFSD